MKYTLITGASSGIGRELAVYLSRERRLILNGRNEERLLETKALCEIEPLVWPFDLKQTGDIEKALSEFVKSQEIEVESFVHCAGLIRMLPVRSLKTEDILDVFSTNVFAPMMIVKSLTSRRVNARNLRSVVFISSNSSGRGAAAFSTYGSSKAALDGLARNLAVELAPNVRVNSVLPGGMLTSMTEDMLADEKLKEKFSVNVPLGAGSPSDIAPIVAFLLSDDARWITGQQITVDGGRTIDITERS